MLVSLPIARTIISVVLMLASACSALAQPAPIGLVIGNGSYAAFPALSACVESSQDIANTLRGLGYRIVERQDVTSGGMAAAIGELSTDMEATPAASVFVYICGYAAGMNERPFLLPVSAVRTYTAKEIAPLLAEQSKLRFLPHTVPSWAAQTNMRNQLEPLPSYTYKEASLNPTNPADRATDWEADIIGAFTRNQELTEFVSTRESALGPTLSLSKPIRLKDPACLSCHSTPAAAPATLIDLYGAANGFG